MVSWRAPRDASMIAAGCLSLLAMFMAVGILLFFTEPANPNILIRYIWLPPALLLPSFLAAVISSYLQRLMLWSLSAVIYLGEYAIIRNDCSRPNANCTPPSPFLSALGSFIGPQVVLSLVILGLVEYSYHQKRHDSSGETRGRGSANLGSGTGL